MNLKVAYMPFANDAAVRQIAESVITNHNANHRVDRFAPDIIFSGADSLKPVFRFQQLYIITHGSPGSDSILATNGASMTVTQLAQQLLAEKLTVYINKIKLYACHGGLHGSNSTAKKLKDALATAGYTSVSVYGYTVFMTGALVGSHKRGEEDIYDPTGTRITEVKHHAAKSVRVRY